MKAVIASRKGREGRKERQNLCGKTRLRFSGQSFEQTSNAVLEVEASRYVHPSLNLCVLSDLGVRHYVFS